MIKTFPQLIDNAFTRPGIHPSVIYPNAFTFLYIQQLLEQVRVQTIKECLECVDETSPIIKIANLNKNSIKI